MLCCVVVLTEHLINKCTSTDDDDVLYVPRYMYCTMYAITKKEMRHYARTSPGSSALGSSSEEVLA